MAAEDRSTAAKWPEVVQTLGNYRRWEDKTAIAALPDEVQALPFWREFVSGKLASRLSVPFYQLYKPQKNERCLAIGCGPSFLTDPWVEWQALFWGLDLDAPMVQAVRTRAPRLNSKLFKDMQEGAPHQLDRYSDGQFDLGIALGFSPFAPLAYHETVLSGLRRILRPGGRLLWEVADPETQWFEDWSIGQAYLGLEIEAIPIAEWQKLLGSLGAIKSRRAGELFIIFLVERA